MSLDVYLEDPEKKCDCICESCGNIHQKKTFSYAYTANITHNLTTMASHAGIYKELWRPEEIGITKAHQLIEPLTKGLKLLKSDLTRFEAFNAPNGWGTYHHFVPFVEEYLNACKENPDANVSVSR